LAGVGSGIYKDIPSACQKLISVEQTFSPKKETAEKYDLVYKKYHALYPALKSWFSPES